MKFPSKVISQPTIIVMNSKISRADLTDSQFLLLIRRCRHRVPVVLLSMRLFLLDFLYLFHHRDRFFNIAFGSQLFSCSQLLANLFSQLMYLVEFGCHFRSHFFLGLREPFLCEIGLPVGFIHKGLEMIQGLL